MGLEYDGAAEVGGGAGQEAAAVPTASELEAVRQLATAYVGNIGVDESTGIGLPGLRSMAEIALRCKSEPQHEIELKVCGGGQAGCSGNLPPLPSLPLAPLPPPRRYAPSGRWHEATTPSSRFC